MKNIFKTVILLSTTLLLFAVFVPSAKATHPDCDPPFWGFVGTYTSISECKAAGRIGLTGCCYQSPVDGTVYGYTGCNWGKECFIGEEKGTCNPRGDCVLEGDCIPFWDCTDWKPSTSAKNCGTTFTQTRTCRDVYCDTEAGRPDEERPATGTYCSGNRTCQNGECVSVSGGETTGGPSQFSGDVFILQNPLQYENFEDLVNAIIWFLIQISTPLAAIMFVISGFMFVTSAGNPERVGTAKRLLLYTAIGYAVILLASGIIKILQELLRGS